MSINIHCDTIDEAIEIVGLMGAGFSEMGELSSISPKNTDVVIGESNEKYTEWYDGFGDYDDKEPYDEEGDDDEG